MLRHRFLYAREMPSTEWGFEAYFKGGGNTNILSSEFVETVGLPTKMLVNDVEVTPSAVYDLSNFTADVRVSCIFSAVDGKPTTLAKIFYNCIELRVVNFGYGINTSELIDMSYMFYGCSSLEDVGLYPFTHTPLLRNMSYMFYGCSSLRDMPTYLWNMDTSNVTNMACMFYGCSSLTSARLGNTSSVTGISSIFSNCYAMESFSVGASDVSNVLDLANIFENCQNLTVIDLSGWNTSKVSAMPNTFAGCTLLTSVTMTGDLSQVGYIYNPFRGVAASGTFYYNQAYDYSSIIAELPSGWSAVPITI